ncbi:MAG: DF family (seleno)protein [Gaiellaceae bacterium]
MRQPRVEILYFEGCPNLDATRALVERVVAELALQPRVELVNVSDTGAAARLRFLGSPTVRVDGRDVEPAVDERREFVLSCRIYRGEHGFSGQPDEAWIRHALAEVA